MRNFSFLLCTVLLLTSCTEESSENNNDSAGKDEVKFVAYVDDNADEEPVVLWERGDTVSLLTGNQSYLFRADSDGYETKLTSLSVLPESVPSGWFVYPYSAECAVSDDGSVNVAMPERQILDVVGMGSGNLSVGYWSESSEEKTVDFYNQCSYISFEIPRYQWVSECMIYTEPESALAGTAQIVLDDEGVPCVSEVIDGVDRVVATAKYPFDGECIVPVLPGNQQVTIYVDVECEDGTIQEKAFCSVNKVLLSSNRLYVLVENELQDPGQTPEPEPDPEPEPENPEYPVLSADKVFWSDAHLSWVYAGTVDSYRIYLNENLAGEVSGDISSFHLTGLSNGTAYYVKVVAVYGAEEKVSEEIEITTGAIMQLTKNVSPTSVAVNIENRAGALSGNYKPCLYVQLFESEDASANPKYEMFVRDNEVQTEGHPFYKSLVAGSGTTYPPFNLAFGGLEAGKDYWFRVKSVASEKYNTYRGSSILGEEREMISANGDSEYSQLFKLSTSPAHVAAENDVYYEGFDDFCFGPDFVNCAVGQMPAFKTYAQSNTAAVTLNKNVWALWDAADKPWCFHGLRTGYSNNQMTGAGLISVQSDGDTDITFDGLSARAVKYWVLVPEGSKKVLAAPKALAGARIGTFKAPATSGFATLLNNTCFMTEDSYVGSGHAILGNYYTTSDAVNSSSKRAGYAVQINSSLLSTSTAKQCVITFKALAVQGCSGELTVIQLDRAANHRNATTDLWQTVATIDIANSNGNTDEAATSWSGTSDTHKWYEYTCEVNLKSGDLICFATDGQSCICLDEITIKTK